MFQSQERNAGGLGPIVTVVLLNSLQAIYCFYYLCDDQLDIYESLSYFIYHYA
jgi:hypothetical protein